MVAIYEIINIGKGVITTIAPANLLLIKSGETSAPIQYLELRKKANGSANVNSPIQPGDIVEGFSPDGTEYWDSAIYNGVDDYTPLVRTGLT